MRTTRYLTVITAKALLIIEARLSPLPATTPPVVHTSTSPPNPGVAPQYDTTHVYVAPEDFDRFVASLLATFGGTATKQGVFTVTPTPSGAEGHPNSLPDLDLLFRVSPKLANAFVARYHG